jgi:hypothetical protein
MKFSQPYLGKLRKIVASRFLGVLCGWITMLICALVVMPDASEALSPNACVPLFDPNYDRTYEAYVSLEISDERSACFMIPLDVIHKELRQFGNPLSLILEPADLLSFVKSKSAVRVGGEERKIDQALIDCLSAPLLDVIMITDGPPIWSEDLESMNSNLLKSNLSLLAPTDSDLRGYRRYSRTGPDPKYREDVYFADPGPDAQRSFWCGNQTGLETCMIEGEYYGMSAKIGYHKEKMSQVSPKEALECVRRIGDLFRIDNDKS